MLIAMNSIEQRLPDDPAAIVKFVNELAEKMDIAPKSVLRYRTGRGLGIIRTRDAAVALGCTKQVVDRLVRAGRLRVCPIAGDGRWIMFCDVETVALEGIRKRVDLRTAGESFLPNDVPR
jgi:hypothetical protein